MGLRVSVRYPLQKILVMEDDMAQSRIIAGALKKSGFEVDTFPSAGDAINALQARSYDVVVTDMIVEAGGRPVPFGGVTLVNWIKGPLQRDEEISSTPVIAISGAVKYPGMENILELVCDQGADLAIEKPFDMPVLVDAIRSLTAKIPQPEG